MPENGLTEDIRIKNYVAVDTIGYMELKEFNNKNIAEKEYSYAIVVSENKIN